jgi:hypothetical protein
VDSGPFGLAHKQWIPRRRRVKYEPFAIRSASSKFCSVDIR